MASRIEALLDNIINAVYGRDVRSAIHDSIEECYSDVSSAKTLANDAVSAANAAATAATNAASNANTKAAAANNAATAANNAASNANTKATAANDAAAAANTAKDNANTAATDARQAANAATTAKDNANAATTLASQAAASANSMASSASAAANDATTAANNASTQADRADAAVSRVNAAIEQIELVTENADAAATNANEKAQRANAWAANAEEATNTAISAAASANNAANSATDAASDAQKAIDSMNTAIYNANRATTNANTAAAAANTAAGAINALTVTSENVGPTDQASASIGDVDGHRNIHFKLKQGETGAPFMIKGDAFQSLDELSGAITSPAIGDQYNVGTEPPYSIYRWTGTKWENQGQLGVSFSNLSTDELDSIWNGTAIESGNSKYINHTGLFYLCINKIKALIGTKVDKIEGKSLSTNDYTDEDRQLNAQNAIDIDTLMSAKVDKIEGKSLSTNDFTDSYKSKLNDFDKSDYFYTAGNTYDSVTSIVLPGFITSSRKQLIFDYRTEKSMANIRTVTITELEGNIRGNTGYVDDLQIAASWLSDYTVTAQKLNNYCIRISIQKSEAFGNTTNNTPLVYWGTVKLRFS